MHFNIKSEKPILTFIKYGPIVFVAIISFIITQIFILQEEKKLEDDIKTIKDEYIKENKARVKEEVEKVYALIKHSKDSANTLLKEEIKNRVYEAHAIATNVYEAESKHDFGHSHDKDHIFLTIKNALGSIIYNNGRGYFFIDNIDGVKLLQPLNKSFEGKNLYNFEDAKGYKFVQKIVQTIQNKTEAYDSYYWYKSKEDSTPYKKISFYKYFEPYNVAIGTGEYVDDFENELKEKVIQQVQNIRFGNNGYIFMYDYKGNSLSHFKKSLIGINRMEVKDSQGNYVVKDVINFAKQNSGEYYHYFATIKTDDAIRTTEKISYIKEFEDWGWVFGAGFYLDALEQQIAKVREEREDLKQIAIEHIIFVSLILTLSFILMSIFVSKELDKRFKKYKDDIDEHVQEMIEKEELLSQQSKMATMGEMISNITHQWKQPLSVISMSAGLLRFDQEMGELDAKKVNRATNEIEESTKYLGQTIDDFKNFFSPNKIKSYFHIEKSVEKTLKLMNAQFQNYDIKIVNNIETIEMYGFENDLLQVLINVFKNAKDELENISSDKKGYIFVDARKENNNVFISIKDNAGGIPKDIMEKVFENYFTTKVDRGGTGIGLYMCQQILKKSLHGTIEVSNKTYEYENESYTGAEFTIVLPIESKDLD